MPRFDVSDTRENIYHKGYVMDATNADVARGKTAERYHIDERYLYAELQVTSEQTDLFMELSDAIHKTALMLRSAVQQAQEKRDHEEVTRLSTLCNIAQALSVAIHSYSHNHDAVQHIKLLEAFQARVCHPAMLPARSGEPQQVL